MSSTITKTADINVAAREIDFVTRFARNWQGLRDIMGVSQLIRKAPGSVLKSKKASVTLESGSVAEGADIPYSAAGVTETTCATMTVEKYAKAVTIEAINDHGYEAAIQLTDDEFLAQLQNVVTDKFYNYLKTGTLYATAATFQAALAQAQGRVINKWKKMNRATTGVVGFCNILDFYDYLGSATITVQNEFGLNYVKNFLGYSTLFLLSDAELAKGRVIATPAENVAVYYVSPEDSDFAKAGLVYRTDGETNLIGFHVRGNYGNATSESFAIMGMALFAEYIDGIANVDIGTFTYTAVSNPSGNPSALGYFEKDSNNEYFPTQDTTVASGKTYYSRTASGA